MKESLEQRVERLESEIAALKDALSIERAERIGKAVEAEQQIAVASQWLMNLIRTLQAGQARDIPPIRSLQKPQ
jgi:hypothetical protein